MPTAMEPVLGGRGVAEVFAVPFTESVLQVACVRQQPKQHLINDMVGYSFTSPLEDDIVKSCVAGCLLELWS